jgi:tetratricopeptide (TPR) repeat protein
MMGQVMAGEDSPQLLQEALARLQRDHERDSPGLVGEVLGLIWAARRGLSEPELLRLLKPVDRTQLPLAASSPLRAAFGDWLAEVDRGGILNFANDSLRAAFETAFIRDEDGRDELRLRLADDFGRQPISARSCDELPWLLLQTESYQRLRHCLLDIDRFLEIKNRDAEELKRYWVDLGEETTMGRLYLASFEQWSKLKGRDEKRIAYAANELGLFLQDAGLYAEAEPLLRSALDLDTKNLGADHPFIAVRLSKLAGLLESMNRLDEVEGEIEIEGMYRRALVITEQHFGPEDHNVALRLSNLSAFLLKTNRIDEAEKLMRRGLAIAEKSLGPDHPNVAIRLSNLAGILQRTNRPAQADPLLRRSLAISESNFGPDHPSVAANLSSLAFVLSETNQQAEVEPILRRVLAIDEKNYGRGHIAVARDLNNLASFLESTDRWAEAEPLYRRAVAVFEKNLGGNHADVGTSLNNLAQVLKKMNRLDEAEPILLRAVQIFLGLTRATQQLDPRLQITINNYGRLLEAKGRSLEQIDNALHEIAPDLYRRVNT